MGRWGDRGLVNLSRQVTPVEAPVKPPFDTSIALGLKLTECENQRPRCADRDQLLAERQTAIEQFNSLDPKSPLLREI